MKLEFLGGWYCSSFSPQTWNRFDFMSQFELRFLESIFCGVNFLNEFCCEKMEMELRLEKKCTEELDDALMRSINGHGRMVEHYADLQEEV
ncbi:putative kinesin-like protein [Helianthus annuus]|nr:putative kinesin-like protein [Helianthus annuus]KAJ0596285.1 putative kinesin-like protein [Helianthus annuus]KAJ0756950.1 putative kinesin-like protein [Helianthus annuus]